MYNVFNPPYGMEEKTNKISMSVPDQSLSVIEILKRYAKGLPLGGQRVPIYEDDDIEGMPDVSKMDLADRQEYFETVKDEVTKIKNDFNANQKSSAAKAAAEKKKLETTGNLHTGNNDANGSKPVPNP